MTSCLTLWMPDRVSRPGRAHWPIVPNRKYWTEIGTAAPLAFAQTWGRLPAWANRRLKKRTVPRPMDGFLKRQTAPYHLKRENGQRGVSDGSTIGYDWQGRHLTQPTIAEQYKDPFKTKLSEPRETFLATQFAANNWGARTCNVEKCTLKSPMKTYWLFKTRNLTQGRFVIPIIQCSLQ